MFKIILNNEELYQVENAIRESISDCECGRNGYEGKRDLDEEIKHTLQNILNQIKKIREEEDV